MPGKHPDVGRRWRRYRGLVTSNRWGPAVTLMPTGTQVATFIAPSVNAPTQLVFRFRGTNFGGAGGVYHSLFAGLIGP